MIPTYLAESKREGSNASFPNNTPKLGDGQIRRHEIFKWYNENRKGEAGEESVRKHAHEDSKSQKKIKIALKGHLPSQNLMTVLSRARGRRLADVLLFFHKGELPRINTSFRVATLERKLADGEHIEPT